MACTSGCLTEQKGSPCLKGLPNVEELSQANLNAGFFICWSSVCRRPRGDVSVLSSHSLMFTSPFSTWKRGRAKGRDQDGKGSGRVCKKLLQLILNLTVPLTSKQPKWHQSLGTFPTKQPFVYQQGAADLPPWNEFLCSFSLELCTDHTRAGLLCTPGAFSSLGCSQIAALAWAVGWNTTGLFRVSPSFHFLSISPSAPLLTLASKCFTCTRYPKLFDKYALAGQFLLPSLLQENVVL